MFMIQPTLLQYKLEQQESVVVLLDTQSLLKNCVLLLDTFFTVLVWYGAEIAAWRNAGYHEQPEYENLKYLIEAPKFEAGVMIKERFPTPQLVICDQDSSLSRFLLTRCNPSSTSHEGSVVARGSDNLGSDEPSYSRFLQKLREASVSD